MKVYLAGPITGLTYAQGQDWREYIAQKLKSFGIGGFSPLRGKDYLKGEGALSGSYEQHPPSTQKGLNGRDRNDVMTADAVIINLLGAIKISIGTMIEIGWADAYRKPVILVMEAGNPHDHPMVKENCVYQVSTLEDAVKLTKVLLCP